MMLRETPDRLAADMPKYRIVNYGDKRFTVRAIKRAIDGALGSRGAWMLEPYADLRDDERVATPTRSTTSGRSRSSRSSNDYQMAVHAIGDRGNRETLNIYEETFKRHPEKNGKALRWRIEHAQHISAADIPRFGQLGVIASMEGHPLHVRRAVRAGAARTEARRGRRLRLAEADEVRRHHRQRHRRAGGRRRSDSVVLCVGVAQGRKTARSSFRISG